MKNLCLLLGLLLSLSLPAQSPLPTAIQSATVYLQGARVVHKSEKASLQVGEQEWVVKKLSPWLDPSSIQVKTEGEVLLLSVNHRRNFLEEGKPDEVRKTLEARQKVLQDSLENLSMLRQSLQAEEQFLNQNRDIGGQNTGIQPEQLQKAHQYYAQRIRGLNRQKLELRRQTQGLQEQITKLQQQLNELGNPANSFSEIVLKIKAERATPATFEISYFTSGASWLPGYDLRATDVNSPVQLAYYANVKQETGEDWNDIKLSFSNANPEQGGTAPQLQPWYLSSRPTYRSAQPDFRQLPGSREVQGIVRDADTGEPLIGATVIVRGTTIGTVTDLDGKFRLNVPGSNTQLEISYVGYESYVVSNVRPGSIVEAFLGQGSVMLEEVLVGSVDGVRRKAQKKASAEAALPTSTVTAQTSVSFELDIPFTLPSDGEVYQVKLSNYEVPADYQYFCAPKMEERVFLTAYLTGWEEYNLLQGEARLFFEDTYVGKALLDTRQAGDTLTLSLGSDKSITVERIKVKEFSKKTFLSGKRTETVAFRLRIRNNKATDIKIKVQDQIPISREKEIEIESEEVSGGKLKEETGLITWEVEVPPGSEQEVLNRYRVKYPQELRLRLD